jgi:hypothetical protein
MRWQAQAKMDFELVGGYAQQLPGAYRRWRSVDSLENDVPGPGTNADLKRFLAAKGVTTVLIDKRRAGSWPQVLERIGLSPMDVGGVLLYRVHR